ncbi:MAG: 30S ribosomal protein S7 [Candidatus Woykebacteria bacterium]
MRGKRVEKRKLEPDKIFSSRLVHRFINGLMRDGKKATAEGIVYKTFDKIKGAGKDPVEIFETAIRNVSPKMEVRPRRIGGASYQVPVEVKGDRREALAIRWILTGAKSKPNTEYKTMVDKLAAELQDAAEGSGVSIKRRDDTHRMAEANKAFAHFRW